MIRIAARRLTTFARPLSTLAIPIQSRHLVARLAPKRTLSVVSPSHAASLKAYAAKIRKNEAVFAQPEPYRTLAAVFEANDLPTSIVQQIIEEGGDKKAVLLNDLLGYAWGNTILKNSAFLKKLAGLNFDSINKIRILLEKFNTLFYPSINGINEVFIKRIVNAEDVNSVFKVAEQFILAIEAMKLKGYDLSLIIDTLHKEDLLDKLLDCKHLESVVKLLITVGCNYIAIIEKAPYALQIMHCLENEQIQEERRCSSSLKPILQKVEPNKALQKVLTEHMDVADDLLAILNRFSVQRYEYEALSVFANNLLIIKEPAFLSKLRERLSSTCHEELDLLKPMIQTNPRQFGFVLELFRMSDHSLSVMSLIIDVNSRFPDLAEQIVVVCKEITEDSAIRLTPTLLENVINKVKKAHEETMHARTEFKTAAKMLVLAGLGGAFGLGIFDRHLKNKMLKAQEHCTPEEETAPQSGC